MDKILKCQVVTLKNSIHREFQGKQSYQIIRNVLSKIKNVAKKKKRACLENHRIHKVKHLSKKRKERKENQSNTSKRGILHGHLSLWKINKEVN